MPDTLIGRVPEEWMETTLAELCSSGGGDIQTGPFGSQLHSSDYVSSGIPSVMQQNIGDKVILEGGIARITPEDAARLSRYLLAPGDIVYSRRGDVERRAWVRPKQAGWLCGTGCLRVRLGSSANSRFMSYYLGHQEVRAWIVRHAIGATMPNLNTGILGAVPVVIPPLPDQVAITKVLGALDDKISVDGRITGTYEDLLRARFEELRIDVDPVPSSAIRASEIVDFNPTLKAPRSSDTVYVDMAAVPTDRATVLDWSRREPKSGTRFANGDTVMARITPCLENGKTAFIDFMEDGEVGIGSTEFIAMRARSGIPVHLPYFLARSPRFRTHAVRNMLGSFGRQRVSAAQLVDFPLARPDSEELSEFGEAARIAFDHIRSLTRESKALTRLRDTLLPKLISGEIHVRDAEK